MSLTLNFQFSKLSPRPPQEGEEKGRGGIRAFSRHSKALASLAALLLHLFASSCAVQQPMHEPTFVSSRKALLEGEIKEALASLESQAREAERNAAASLFPQQYWEAAANAYSEASRMARWNGQLQKSIAFAEKGLEMADNAKRPDLQVQTILHLSITQRFLGNFDKSKELTEKGLVFVKRISSNSSARGRLEGALYSNLGSNLVRQRKYESAIHAFTQSIELYESVLGRLRPGPRSGALQDDVRTTIIMRLDELADAYTLAGAYSGQIGHPIQSKPAG